jgi:hypothetical protein
MTQNKMTKRDWFEVLASLVENSDYTDKDGAMEFINHELELLAKKSSSSTKTKTQKENEVFVERVYEELATLDKAMTVSELMTATEYLAQFSNQKLSALLKKLVDTGRVDKTVEGKKSYFKVASGE